MKREAVNLIDEAKSNLGAYTALYNLQLSYFCVKADPIALLPLTVSTDEGDMKIETAADVTLPQEDRFGIYPKDQAWLYQISKTISENYPEFKIEVKENEENEGGNSNYILCTIPPVDADRKKAGLEYTDNVHSVVSGKMDASFSGYAARVAKVLADYSDEERKETAEKLKEIYKQYQDICSNFKQDKENEIEEAYQRYLSGEAEAASEEKEKKESEGEGVGKSINMSGGSFPF